MSARCLFLCISLMLMVQSTAFAALDDDQPASFADILNTYFEGWDKDADGKLSREEVDALVASPAIKGDVAAAVAALHIYFRDNSKAGPVSRTFAIQAAERLAREERRDVAHSAPSFQADYNRFRTHLQDAPRKLFAYENALQLQGIEQGNLGDCYFVSMVGAAVNADRDRVKRMFHPIEGGVCEVEFLDGSKTTVRLTDAQIALSSTTGSQGLWLNVLEQGFAQVRFNGRQKKPGDIPLDVISRGGYATTAIPLLTGHKAMTVNLNTLRRDPETLRKLKAIMVACAKNRLIMGAGIDHGTTVPPGIVSGHAYAVMGFDPFNDFVHLWNPWGNFFRPLKEPTGWENGYIVREGHSYVPFADFMRIFGHFDYETLIPVTTVAQPTTPVAVSIPPAARCKPPFLTEKGQ